MNNQLLRDLCELYKVKLIYTYVNYPQSKGSTQRFMNPLLEMIRDTVTNRAEDHPVSILYADIFYRNSIDDTHWYTPYELIFGHIN